jgi:hypothetical protein
MPKAVRPIFVLVRSSERLLTRLRRSPHASPERRTACQSRYVIDLVSDFWRRQAGGFRSSRFQPSVNTSMPVMENSDATW